MEVPQIVAAVVVCLSMLIFLKKGLTLARLGLTEYAGGADFLRRSLGPMAASGASAAGGATFIAYPGWLPNLGSTFSTYFPADQVMMIQQFAPMLGFALGIALLIGLMKTA